MPRRSFLLIAGPMLAAFLGERLYNHLVDPEAKVFVAGFHVHHLFFGIALAGPAAFYLALRVRDTFVRRAALAALGAGSGLILDEFVAMIATDMSTPSYLSRTSWLGAGACVAAAGAFLAVLAYRSAGE